MDGSSQYFRVAIRKLARAPLFTLATVGTLALGIGANSAIFSVVNGVLLKPLPFEEPNGLVGVWHTAPGLGFIQGVNMSPATYFTYREHAQSFEEVALWDNRSAAITGLDRPEQVQVMIVTDGLLPMLGVQPVIGRRFTAEDDSHGAAETVMLSFAYWRRQFGEDRGVLGQTLTVNGRPREIIGVLPQRFQLPRTQAAIYMPIQFDRSEVSLGNFNYQGIARLRDGVSLAKANAEIDRLAFRAAEDFPVESRSRCSRRRSSDPMFTP